MNSAVREARYMFCSFQILDRVIEWKRAYIKKSHDDYKWMRRRRTRRSLCYGVWETDSRKKVFQWQLVKKEKNWVQKLAVLTLSTFQFYGKGDNVDSAKSVRIIDSILKFYNWLY